MLYTLPEVTNEINWLHCCIEKMIHSLEQNLINGTEVGWPEIIPEEHRNVLQQKHGLRKRWNSLVDEVTAQNTENREMFFEMFNQQNRVVDLLKSHTTCQMLSDLPDELGTRAKDFFGFAYEKMSDLGVRKVFHQTLAPNFERYRNMCLYCGLEYIEPSGSNYLDHYLHFDSFPFASTNLRNLVFAGSNCNSRYKGMKNIIKLNTNWRPAFDPYGVKTFRYELLDTDLDISKAELEWNQKFVGENALIITHLDVFKLKERYAIELDSQFRYLVSDFAQFNSALKAQMPNDNVVLESFREHLSNLKLVGIADKGVLKIALAELILQLLENGDARIFSFLTNSIVKLNV